MHPLMYSLKMYFCYTVLLEKNQEVISRMINRRKRRLDEADKYLLLDEERFKKAVRYESDSMILRDIIIKGLDQNRHNKDLSYAIDQLSVINNAELRKAAIRLIQSSKYDNSVFEHCVTALALQNQAELIKVLRVLFNVDKERYRYYVDEIHIVEILKYKNRLDSWIKRGEDDMSSEEID